MGDVKNSNEMGLVGKTFILFMITLVALCVFQSSALRTLAYDLPPGVWTERIIVVAEGWHSLMVRCGAVQVTESVSGFVSNIREPKVDD